MSSLHSLTSGELRLALLAVLAAIAFAITPGRAGAATTAKVGGGKLTIKGDAKADAIAFGLNPAAPDLLRVDVNDDGTTDFSFKRDKFTQIVVNAGGGNDRVRVDNSGGIFTDTEQTAINGEAGADALTGGFGPEVLSGGDGNDTVNPSRGTDVAFLGAGDDVVTWNPGDGSDTIEGQGDRDTLQFNGANIGENFALSN